jgi:DNA-binding IclR family transcriptional regulator
MQRKTIDDVLKAALADTPLEPFAIQKLIDKGRRDCVSAVRDTMMVGLSSVSAPVFATMAG